MSDKPVRQPGPDHPIDVQPASGPVTVRWRDKVIAESDSALMLREAGYPSVPYLPLADVVEDVLEPTDHATYCPYKGDAAYFSLHDETAGAHADNAVWTYPAPHAAVAEIANHVAFYPDQVDIDLPE
jgi:uncharacterized protein (DUF427 family)